MSPANGNRLGEAVMRGSGVKGWDASDFYAWKDI